MAKLPAIQFYPGDYLRDPVAGCSLAAQGLWLRLMFIAHESPNYGYIFASNLLEEKMRTVRRCGCSLEEFDALFSELKEAGIPGFDGDLVYSRRMVRDAKLRDIRAKAGKKGGKQSAKQKSSKTQANTQAKPKQNTEDEVEDEDAVEDLNKKKIVTSDDVPVPASMDTPEVRSAVAAWLVYKRKRGEGYKDGKFLGLKVAEFETAGADAFVAAVKSSIGSNYSGLFPAKEVSGGKQRSADIEHNPGRRASW